MNEMKYKWIFMARCLLLAYIITLILLAVLAFVMLQFQAPKTVMSALIIILYAAVNMFSGILAGRHMKEKRFLWGVAAGGMYFGVLLLLSLITQGGSNIGTDIITTFILCAGGGMLGGMIS